MPFFCSLRVMKHEQIFLLFFPLHQCKDIARCDFYMQIHAFCISCALHWFATTIFNYNPNSLQCSLSLSLNWLVGYHFFPVALFCYWFCIRTALLWWKKAIEISSMHSYTHKHTHTPSELRTEMQSNERHDATPPSIIKCEQTPQNTHSHQLNFIYIVIALGCFLFRNHSQDWFKCNINSVAADSFSVNQLQ